MPSSLGGFHVAFERGDDAIDGIVARLFRGLALGQRFRNSRKAHEPPAILLPLQPISL